MAALTQGDLQVQSAVPVMEIRQFHMEIQANAHPSFYLEGMLSEEDTMEINLLYWFGDVLGRLFDRNIEGMEQTRQIIFDVCMHYIVQLDLRQGCSK